MVKLTFEAALLPTGFSRRVSVTVGNGRIVEVIPNDSASTPTHALALPGMVNLHSHAFQRAMAGFAEVQSSNDTFWGWRDRMYALAEHLTIAEIGQIAEFVYGEMLTQGYTQVAEFHYLHKPSQSSSAFATAKVVRQAALSVGIRQCLMPVAYQRGGFDNRPLNQTQTRFALTTDELKSLWSELSQSEAATLGTGLAIHSLRAVDIEQLHSLAEHCHNRPIHIHISEQRQEVIDCQAVHAKTPIDLLLGQKLVGPHWCLVHATHASRSELERLRSTQAVVGYCPTTEANLGDGFFDFEHWQALGGAYGIGSDSQVSVNPAEELRLIEYQRRLQRQKRPGCQIAAGGHVGETLWQAAVSGGWQVTEFATDINQPAATGLCVGAPFDVIELATSHPSFTGQDPATVLDTFIMAERSGMINRVWVHGECLVENGVHRDAARLASNYRQVLKRFAQ